MRFRLLRSNKNNPSAKKDNKMSTKDPAFQKCINPGCGAEFDCGQAMFKCPKCGELLDARYDWDKMEIPDKLSDFGRRWATSITKRARRAGTTSTGIIVT